MVRRNITLATLAGCASMLGMLVLAPKAANADRVHFNFTGGSWSHSYHSGWNRYWGGPSIGFYYAPSPVYVVPGYGDPSYYDGPDFWYGNPAFGLSLNFGGGGGGGYYGGGYHHGGGHYSHGGGGHVSGFSSHGGHGGGHSGGHGGGHGGHRR